MYGTSTAFLKVQDPRRNCSLKEYLKNQNKQQ